MRSAILMVAAIAAAVACSESSTTHEVYTPSGPVPIPTPPGTITTVDVTPTRASLAVGTKTRLKATPKDQSGAVVSGVPVAWNSSDTQIATVSDSGDVRALKTGSALITATAQDAAASANITVGPAPVGSVSVSLAASSVQVGTTTQATVVVKDSTGAVVTDRSVTWSSSATSIATVSSSGVVNGLAAGTATITATSEGKNGSASVTVTTTPPPPPAPVASVTVSLGSSSVVAGGSTQATAVLKDASGNVLTGRTIAWSSSNPSVASVSSTGVATAVTAGTANVVAISEGVTGQATLTVTAAPPPAVASVVVTLNASSITVGQSTQATAITKDAGGNVLTGRVITWSSTNTAVATVNGSGLVTSVAPGTASIRATSEGINGSATVTVALVPVASVVVTLNSSSITAGQSTQASAVTKDAGGNVLTGRVITWSSSNTAVATVNSTGLVQAVSAGTASIRATSEGVTGSATLTVTASVPAPVATVTLSPSTLNLTVGNTGQLAATLKDASGNTLTGRVITWSSSNTAFATVSGTGVVTGVAVGSATITATSEGKSGTAAVTVATVVSPGPGVPVYDPSNSDHVLHVFEDWSSYNSIADISSRNRVDGGGSWTDLAPSYKSFTTSNNDPWFGKKTLDLDYQAGPAAGQSLGHGLNLEEGTPTRFLNAGQVKAALVIEWAWRMSGSAAYVGKFADWQPYAGLDRFNYQLSYDPMGAQTNEGVPGECDVDPLCSKYYTNGGKTPRFAGLMPTARTEGMAFARSDNNVTYFYTQNRNYGTGAGQVSWGGNGETMLDNVWRRTILRLTLNANGVMGQGRLEEWLQVAGQPAVKVMEYIGDVGGFDQGLVRSRDGSLGGSSWLNDGSILHWYNLSAVAGNFNGGSTVHLGYFRMWSQSRQ